MIKHLMLVVALSAAGCTKAKGNEAPTTDRGSDRGAAPRAKASVTLTSVTFADDCGGTPPFTPPANVPANAPATPASPAVVAPSESRAPGDSAPDVAHRRRCEQTSMQLAIAGGADTTVQIKSVEVLDETGKSLGTLATSKPTRWNAATSTYDAWDEKIGAGQNASVSYVLAQPPFVDRYDSHDRTYTVKVVASVGGVDQPLQTTVMVVGQPAPVPT